jgi:hypothetical protein
MRLVLAISLFLGGTASFWIAFHSAAVPASPTPGGVLASLKKELTGAQAETSPNAPASATAPGDGVIGSGGNAISNGIGAAEAGVGTSLVNPVSSAISGTGSIIDGLTHDASGFFSSSSLGALERDLLSPAAIFGLHL